MNQLSILICLCYSANYQVHDIPWFTMSIRSYFNDIMGEVWMLYLRSFILNYYNEVLRSNTLPAQWTKAATILIHNESDPSLPKNFRVTTLKLLASKIFASLLQTELLRI